MAEGVKASGEYGVRSTEYGGVQAPVRRALLRSASALVRASPAYSVLRTRHSSAPGLPLAQLVAQAGGRLVVLRRDGPVELFAERLADTVRLAQTAFHLPQLLHHAVFFHTIFDAEMIEESA